jgi:hypothetical protein
VILYSLGGIAFVVAGPVVLGDARGAASFMHKTYRRLGPSPKGVAYTRYISGALMLLVGVLLVYQAFVG